MGKLIYSIVSVKNNSEKLNSLLLAMKGVAGANLSAVTVEGISAIVSGIKKEMLVADRQNALLFAGIIENLKQLFTILPMRFGSVADSDEVVKMIIVKNYTGFYKNLQDVENKFEFGLKIFCDTEKLKEELRDKTKPENNTSHKTDIETKNSVYREYVDKKLHEHRLEEKLLRYIDSIIAEFMEYISQVNAVKKIQKRTNTNNIIDAVFLLEKDKKDGLVQVVEKLQNKHPRLNFVLTGPWAPYNFAEITLK